MSEKEKQIPRSPETEKSRETGAREYWEAKRGEILVKNGFPRHALDMTRVMDVVTIGGRKAGKPELSLVYADHFLKCEPFKTGKEFEAVCKKIAGYYEETQRNRIKVLDHHTSELGAKIRKQVGREWTYQPQECPGTYTFEEGKGRQTIGVIETFLPEEVRLFVISLRKRLCEQKLLPENLDKEAAGLDSPQIFEANDKTIIHAVDRFDHEMKKSGEFNEEEDFWVLGKADELILKTF